MKSGSVSALMAALRAGLNRHSAVRLVARRPRVGLLLVTLLMLGLVAGARAQGTLNNGFTHTGTISPAGDADSWTFAANSGDRITVRVGEITQTGNFSPRIRLMNPASVLQATASGAVGAEISVVATNTGTFTLVVDDVVGTVATGTYRVTLARLPGTVSVAAGDEGGPMTNGVMHTGMIDVGDLDLWTFSATNGESLTIRMGETTTPSALTPALWLYGPTGALLDSFGASTVAGEVYFRATNSGTFTLVVGDYSNGYAGSGTYRLTLAKTGDPIVVSAGDEGGPMTNGVTHTGNLEVGDVDIWNFAASAGESLTVRVGELVVGSSLTPALWLYGPTGALLDSIGSSTVAGEVYFRATNSGTFTIVVGDYSNGYAGAGTYRLTLAKTGSPIVVSSGDEGGPMTNGVTHTGTLEVGDVDLWNFAANTGESITVRVGELTTGSLTPALWLYGPTGALLDSMASGAAAEVYFRATNSGTFTIVVGDYSNGWAGSGTYRLTLAKTGSPIVVSAGDEGGLMTNGLTHTGNLEIGDVDIWNFTAAAGDNIVVRIGELLSGSSLTPAVWLYGPTGALLDSLSGAAAAEVTFHATNSGTFTVVAGDYSSGYAGSGGYRLTLAKTPGDVLVTAGDEGGAMTGVGTYDGSLSAGDLDVFSFTACAGDELIVRMDEVVTGGPLTPWLRLYVRNGTLMSSVSGAATAQFNLRATNSGTFTLVAGDFSNGYAGSGAYRLTVNGLSAGLKLCAPVVSGSNYALSAVGGPVGGSSVVHTHTNVAAPFAQWAPARTNVFDSFGVFRYTNAFNRAEPQRYFRLQLP